MKHALLRSQGTLLRKETVAFLHIVHECAQVVQVHLLPVLSVFDLHWNESITVYRAELAIHSYTPASLKLCHISICCICGV
jgi:hypothetical protein